MCFKAAKEKQKIRAEEIQIEVVERKKQIEVEEKEVSRKDKELVATVRRPAEAESYKVETIAQGRRSVCLSLFEHGIIDNTRIKNYNWFGNELLRSFSLRPTSLHKCHDFLSIFSWSRNKSSEVHAIFENDSEIMSKFRSKGEGGCPCQFQ